MSKDATNKMLYRNRKGLSKYGEHIKEGRNVFFNFDNLSPEHKNLIIQNTNNTSITAIPEYSIKSRASLSTPIESKLSNVLVSIPSDIDFINNYRLPNGKLLMTDKARLIVIASTILNAIARMRKKQILKNGFKSTTAFYKEIANYIEANNIPLPTSEPRLRNKASLYKKNGAIEAIPKYFGVSNASKIGQSQEALILSLRGLHNQLNAVQIASIYNRNAVIKEWKPVSQRTIINVCQKHRIEIKGAREGAQEWRNEFDHSVKRQRPSAPNYLWVGDGWDFELYYQKRSTDSKQRTHVSYWERKKVYMVIDAYNDYIVGYSIGDNENIEITKAAWKDACVKQGVLPFQIKTDNFAKTELTPFYQQICCKPEFFTPAAVGNARDKVIERMFGQLYSEVVTLYPNASGRNITAKQKPNRDVLDKKKHEFPDEQGVIAQIHEAIHIWNSMQRKKLNGKSLELQCKEGDHSKDRQLSDLQRLQYFGTPHKYLNTFTNKGLEVTIDGKKITYRDWENKELMDSIGIEYQVIYDNCDLSKILIMAEGGGIRHVIYKDEAIPMAYMDMKEGHRTNLNIRLDEKKRNLKENVIDKANERDRILEREGLTDILINENSAEGLLKLRPVLKGLQKPMLEEAEKALKIVNKAKETSTKKFVPYPDKLTDDCKPVE